MRLPIRESAAEKIYEKEESCVVRFYAVFLRKEYCIPSAATIIFIHVTKFVRLFSILLTHIRMSEFVFFESMQFLSAFFYCCRVIASSTGFLFRERERNLVLPIPTFFTASVQLLLFSRQNRCHSQQRNAKFLKFWLHSITSKTKIITIYVENYVDGETFRGQSDQQFCRVNI